MSARVRRPCPAVPLLAAALLLAATGSLAAPPEPAKPDPPEPVLGAASSWDSTALAEALVTLPAGTGLRVEPDLALSAVVLLESETELPLLERRGAWVRVRHEGFRGWALLGAGATPDAEEIARRLPRTGAPDGSVLAAARAAFERAPVEHALAGYILITDVEERERLADFERIARHLETTYAERFGLAPTPGPPQAVVLFRHAEDYQRYVADHPLLEESQSHGHAGNGVAVLAVGSHDRDAVRALFVHELTHLLNRRALGTDLPAWIDEGLAEDLAYSRVAADGTLAPGSLAGTVRVVSGAAANPADPLAGARSVQTSGPFVLVSHLLRSWGDSRRAPLASLLSLPSSTLSDPELRSFLYPLSAVFVRFLLDGGDGTRRESFLRLLSELARGERPDGAAQAAFLGGKLDELEPLVEARLRRTVEASNPRRAP